MAAVTENLDPTVLSILQDFQYEYPDVPVIQACYSTNDPNSTPFVCSCVKEPHTNGFAMDFYLGSLDDAQCTAVTTWWLNQGATAIGYYPTTMVLHVDFYKFDFQAWGPDFTYTSLPKTPSWFQSIAYLHLAQNNLANQLTTTTASPLNSSLSGGSGGSGSSGSGGGGSGIGGAISGLVGGMLGKAVGGALGNALGGKGGQQKDERKGNQIGNTDTPKSNAAIAKGGPQSASGKPDIKGRPSAYYPTTVQSACTRVPSHEPWPGHPRGLKGPRSGMSNNGGNGGTGNGGTGNGGTGRGGGGNGGVGGGSRGGTGGTGWWTKQNQAYAVDYLMKNAGLTKLAAVGLVSRFVNVESTQKGADAVNPSSGAIGIAQWLGSRKREFLASGDTSFEGQLKFVAKELNSTESRAKKNLNAATNNQEAADAAAQFERAEGYNGQTDNHAWKSAAGADRVAANYDAVQAGDTSPDGGGPTPDVTGPGSFRAVGNYRSGVDKRLTDILKKAAIENGFKVEIFSGVRDGNKGFHPKGMATDVRLFDKNGKAIPNYQDAEGFRAYEIFAQAAKRVQMRDYPEMGDGLRWGGYFGGPEGHYGALDTMHFDLGGLQGAKMGGGSWEGGLTKAQRNLWPGANSQGMGIVTPAPAPQSQNPDPKQTQQQQQQQPQQQPQQTAPQQQQPQQQQDGPETGDPGKSGSSSGESNAKGKTTKIDGKLNPKTNYNPNTLDGKDGDGAKKPSNKPGDGNGTSKKPVDDSSTPGASGSQPPTGGLGSSSEGEKPGRVEIAHPGADPNSDFFKKPYTP